MFSRIMRGLNWMRTPYAFLDNAQRQHGLTFDVDLPVLGDALVTGDPQLVVQAASHPALQAGMAVPAIRALLGEKSMITLDGEEHAARRRLIAPLFRGDHLHIYDRLAVEATRAIILPCAGEESATRNTGGRAVSIYEPLRRISLQVILRAMFGSAPDVVREATTLVERFIHSFSNPLVLFVRPLRVDLGGWSPWGRAMLNRRRLCEFISCQMHRTEIEMQNGAASGSMLAAILQQREACSVDDDAAVQEILALLLFGHDTGAAALSWAVVHLLQHPAAVAQIRNETRSGDASSWAFLRACLRESLRLCPVVPHLSRVASEEFMLGEYRIAAGRTVIPCTYLAHRNPQVFPQPHVFQPERFSGDALYAGSYFPFGTGSRTCVGKPFIMRQMMVILATLFQTVNLSLPAGYTPLPVRRLLLITPSQGGRVVISSQKPAGAMLTGAP